MISRREVLKLSVAGLIVPTLGSTSTTAAAVVTQESSASVPMWRGNAAGTGEMPGPGPSLDKPIVVKWRFAAEWGFATSPAVADGTVFVGGAGSLFALDAASGTERWRFTTSAAFNTSPAVADGTVFAGSRDGNVYAIDAQSGETIWFFPAGDEVNSNPIVTNGIVLVRSGNNGTLHAIDASSGEERWRIADVRSESPSADNDTVFICVAGGLIALDSLSGQERWRFSVRSQAKDFSSPATSGGVIFFYSGEIFGESFMHAIDALTGEELWRAETGIGPNVPASPAVANDAVFFSDSTGYDFCAFEASTGDERWRIVTGTFGTSSPSVADGTVFFGAGAGNGFHAVDASLGEELWRFDPGNFVRSGPAVVGGVIYIAGFRQDEDGPAGDVIALGNLVPAVLTKDVVLRRAPSPSGIERGNAKVGDEVENIGTREERDGQEWAEVTIGDVTGWIPLDAIDPATLPPEGEIEYVYIPD